MKTIRFYGIVSLLTLTFTITSCVKDGDFSLPKLTQKAPDITANTNIKAIQSALNQEFKKNKKLIYKFDEKKNLWASGYVVSSDKTGNFYKKLIIQDKPENPTAGIEILIDKTALSETFDFGRKVYILLDGLSVSYNDGGKGRNPIDPTNAVGGKFLLGKDNGNGKVEGIAAATYTNYIKRGVAVAKIIPTKIAIKDFSQKNVNTFVELTDMQFQKSALGSTFAGEDDDSFDGLRTLTDGATTTTLQTSTFASFKSNIVPEKKGDVLAVLTKDYRATNYVVIINKPSDLQFSKDRVDPIFEEDFQTAENKKPLNIKGWTTFAEKGRRLWRETVYKGNGYVEFSCFKTRDAENIGWLVSPPIDMDAGKNEALSFKTSQHHLDSDDNKIEVFVSTDFNGTDVTGATWQPITAQVAKKADKWYAFKDSGAIDISAYTGKLYIAFKVTGSGTNKKLDGTFMVDDVVITGAK